MRTLQHQHLQPSFALRGAKREMLFPISGVVLLVDVLHHADAGTQMALLAEAVRVSRRHLLIKDHTLEGLFSGPTPRFMDWVGNARHGVGLPNNYWYRARWLEEFGKLKLNVGVWERDLGLYPAPVDWILGRSLHFIARLDRMSGAE